MLLVSLLAGAIGAVVGGFGALALVFGGRGGRASATAIIAMVVLFFLVYVAMIIVIYPYVTSRLQNLVWGRTRGALVEFGSDLRFWPLLRLTLKNWLLVLLTLGLYLPFAKVATARLRLDAMSVQTLLPPDDLVDRAAPARGRRVRRRGRRPVRHRHRPVTDRAPRPGLAAEWFDGSSARAVRVTLRIDGDTLRIERDDGVAQKRAPVRRALARAHPPRRAGGAPA